jgi:hypothetical protein
MRKRYVGLLPLLLVALFGCASEDSTLPSSVTDTNAGSYRLNSQVVSCQASATSGYILSGADSLESVSVQLEAPSKLSTSASPYLILDFHRLAAQPNTPYQLDLVTYFDGDYTKSVMFPDNVVATLQKKSTNVVSGTFSTKKSG